MKKPIFLLYGVALVGLFLFSFTQIDLSLTFSRIDFLRNLVKSFQYIGYFQRPLSTGIYVSFLLILYAFYFIFLRAARKGQLTRRQAWTLIFATTIILVFSYNAYSYDIFNYIFDAKIFTHYHQNPYLHKALDFPGDPMLSFMRWTHRVYPYGPVWLVLTVPLSFLGFNLFLPTFALFKLLMAASFLGSLHFISKILRKIAPDKEVWGLIFLGINPLVVIETLVSGHLDIVMYLFCFWSLYLLLNRKYPLSFLLIAVSIGIKFATGFLLPIYFLIIFQQIKHQKINWRSIFTVATILMIFATIAASSRTTFQPWYLIGILASAVFISDNFIIFFPSIIISFFALLTYVPYLFTGNWDPPIPQILTTMYLSSYIASAGGIFAYIIVQTRKAKFSFKNLRKSLHL